MANQPGSIQVISSTNGEVAADEFNKGSQAPITAPTGDVEVVEDTKYVNTKYDCSLSFSAFFFLCLLVVMAFVTLKSANCHLVPKNLYKTPVRIEI